MKKDKSNTLHPLVGGLIGGTVIPVAAVLGMLILAAVFMGVSDPNSYVLTAACIAVGIGGVLGGVISVKLTGALISAVYAAVTALLIMAIISMFLPESQGVLARLLPPLTLALSPLLGGYIAIGKKQTQADMIKKAAKRSVK